MLLNILLVFHIIVCILLIITVLMQQSEGGALGMGGGPSGFMSARGAGNLLTRVTWILFTLFLLLSIGLTVLAASQRNASSITGGIEKVDPNSLKPALPTTPTPGLDGGPAPTPGALPSGIVPADPLAGAAPATPPAAPTPAQ